MQKSVALLYTKNETSERKMKKTIQFTTTIKNKMSHNKLYKGGEGPIHQKLQDIIERS